jgi:hypothetical protein
MVDCLSVEVKIAIRAPHPRSAPLSDEKWRGICWRLKLFREEKRPSEVELRSEYSGIGTGQNSFEMGIRFHGFSCS